MAEVCIAADKGQCYAEAGGCNAFGSPECYMTYRDQDQLSHFLKPAATTEEQIERVAEAIRTAYIESSGAHRPPWSATPDHRKKKWRDMARAALEVAR